MSDQKPRKWRLRITVRVLMIVIFVLAVGIALPVSRAKRQEAAISRIAGSAASSVMITTTGRIAGIIPLAQRRSAGPSMASPGRIDRRKCPPRARSGYPNEGPPVPRWLLKSLGPDFFRRANFVSLAEFHQKLRAIPDLAFLEDLPDVRVLHLDSRSFADSELAHAPSAQADPVPRQGQQPRRRGPRPSRRSGRIVGDRPVRDSGHGCRVGLSRPDAEAPIRGFESPSNNGRRVGSSRPSEQVGADARGDGDWR